MGRIGKVGKACKICLFDCYTELPCKVPKSLHIDSQRPTFLFCLLKLAFRRINHALCTCLEHCSPLLVLQQSMDVIHQGGIFSNLAVIDANVVAIADSLARDKLRKMTSASCSAFLAS